VACMLPGAAGLPLTHCRPCDWAWVMTWLLIWVLCCQVLCNMCWWLTVVVVVVHMVGPSDDLAIVWVDILDVGGVRQCEGDTNNLEF